MRSSAPGMARADSAPQRVLMPAESPRPAERAEPLALASSKLFGSRTVLLFGEVSTALAESVCAQLLAHAAASAEPIRMVLHSPGGHVEAGDSIYDVIRYVTPRVRILASGWVASAGALIYSAAELEDRLSLPNTRFMLHQPLGGVGGSASDVEIEARQIMIMRERLNRIFARATAQTYEKIVRDTDRNYWMSAEDAKAYGLVSRIIERQAELEAQSPSAVRSRRRSERCSRLQDAVEREPGGGERAQLNLGQRLNAFEREVDHAVDVAPRNGFPFGRALDLDDRGVGCGDHVQIDTRGAVFEVAEVERERAVDVTDADGRHLVAKWRPFEQAALFDHAERRRERHPAAGDGCGARAAVGFEHVAVERDRALAECLEVDRSAQGTADQALDLARAAAQRAVAAVARFAPLGIGARMHLVLGRDPAFATPGQKIRHAIIERRGAQDDRATRTVQHRAFGEAMEPDLHFDGPQGPRVAPAAFGDRHSAQSLPRTRGRPGAADASVGWPVADPEFFKLSETFESLQGEGPSAGAPAFFLRLALCNLRCSWCDTRYTWDFERYRYDDEVHEIPVAELLHRIEGSRARRLIVTGGEPLLQTGAIERLLERLAVDWVVEIETNGTLSPSAALSRRVNQWNVSVKLAHSGESLPRRIKPAALDALRATGRAYLKLVVRSPADRAEVDELIEQLGWPRERVYLMPEVTERALHEARALPVAALCSELGVRFSPRLHVLLWGGERGR